MRKVYLLASAALLSLAGSVSAAPVLSAMTTFGGGDGWLTPAENSNLTTGSNNRAMAYNPATGHVLFASTLGANGFIGVLDSSTGAQVGSLTMTGVTGGAVNLGAMRVDSAGVIYACNVVTNGTNYKIYRWADESSASTTAYTGVSPLAGARLGDNLDLIGTGTNTKLVTGFGNTPSIAGNSGYAVFSTADGLSYTGSAVAFATNPPAGGDHRLGITFAGSANDIMGTQGSGLLRVSSYSGTVGTLAGTGTVGISERLMDYTTILGVPYLAIQSNGDSHVAIYDMTNPLSPSLVASANNTITPAGNTNGTGGVSWGTISGDTATLYAMSTNQGIQAFTFVVPEPASLSLLALGGVAMLRRRK